MSSGEKLFAAAFWLTLASSALIVVGIAPSQILLGAALLALLLSRARLELPPIKLPLALFIAGTLIAIALSGDPRAGWPQIKKFYVFTQLLVVFTCLKDLKAARWITWAWAAFGAASAALGLAQFAIIVHRIHALHEDFYSTYMARRITGFAGHWYTFSVEEMIALLMLAAFVFFAPSARKRLWLWIPALLLMTGGILLAETRAVWIATIVGAVYLVWCWRKWVALLLPVAALGLLLISPAGVRERALSVVHPGKDDSNQFRTILARTGVRMIEAHPWFGVGPEMTRKRFFEFLPADVPRPLPAGSYMHLHNLYLEYAAERGLPFLAIFFWLIGKILWDMIRAVRHAPSDRRFVLHGAIAMILALLVEAFADVNLADSEDLTMFLVVVALAYRASENAGQVSRSTAVPAAS